MGPARIERRARPPREAVNKVSSILGGVVVIAIAVVFIVQFRPASGTPVAEGPTCVAELRGDCIPTTHYWAAFRLLAPRGADPGQLKAMGLKRQTLDGLIERHLLVEDAKRLGITVEDAEVTKALAAGHIQVSLPAANADQVGYALGLGPGGIRFADMTDPKTGKFDAQTYEKQVRAIAKMSPTDFRNFQKEEMIAARMREVIRTRVRVSEAEAKAQYLRDKSTATASYVRFESAFYADRLDSSDEAIADWVGKNQAEVDKVWESRKAQFEGECRVGRHLLVRIDPASLEALEPEKQKAEAEEKIKKARERIQGGEDFEKIVSEMSDGPTKDQGGEITCATMGQFPKPVEDAAKALAKGDLSATIETAEGLHLVQIEKILKGDDALAFGKRATERELYRQFEGDRLAAEAAKSVLSAVRGGKALDAALEEHLASAAPDRAPKPDDDDPEKNSPEAIPESIPLLPTVEVTLPFNQSGDPIPGVKPGQSVAKLVFDLQKPGDVPADVIALETGYAVVQLKEKTAIDDKQWEEDAEFYRTSMRLAKQQDALTRYVKGLREALAGEVKVNQAVVGEEAKDPDEGPAP